jgi:hypothetical protein
MRSVSSGEVDLDAACCSERIDHHRSGKEAGRKAAETFVVAGSTAEPNRKRAAEIDHERYH